MTDLHRTDIDILFVLFETESAVGERNDTHDNKNDADNASRFHEALAISRVDRRRG